MLGNRLSNVQTLTQVLLCMIARLHLSTGYAVPATLQPSWQPSSAAGHASGRLQGGCAQCVQGRWQRPSAVCSAGMHAAAPMSALAMCASLAAVSAFSPSSVGLPEERNLGRATTATRARKTALSMKAGPFSPKLSKVTDVSTGPVHGEGGAYDEDHRLARLLKHDLLDLNRRIMASPYELGAEVPVGATCFSLEKLRSEAGRGPVSQQLCQELRRNHFVIVRPDAAGQAAVHDMWAQARRFFDLPAERKEDAAGWVRVACATCLCSPAVRVDGHLADDCASYTTSTLCVTTSVQAYAKGRGQRRGHRVGHHAG
jgi:hypothetical protein